MSRVVIWAVLSGAGATALLVLWRDFSWQYALIIGIAVAALVYSGFRTVDRLRDLHRG